jgi:RNA polymerase sigma factor (sigma-70 family)
VERLLNAPDRSALESAWSGFLDDYNRLILHTARSLGGSYDDVMDRYAHALEQLRRDDFRRLRGYAADGRGKFSTWLVVVVRRLCYDQVRSRYGRHGASGAHGQQLRRDLVDLVAADLDPDHLPTTSSSPEAELRATELEGGLSAAIARLDPSDRLLLRLRYQDDVPIAEIARALSYPSIFHVYRQLNRILSQLRSLLREVGIREAAP